MNQILYNALKSDNIPNLLLYGIKNSGKKTQKCVTACQANSN